MPSSTASHVTMTTTEIDDVETILRVTPINEIAKIAKETDPFVLKAFFDANPNAAQQADENGFRLFHYAAFANNAKLFVVASKAMKEDVFATCTFLSFFVLFSERFTFVVLSTTVDGLLTPIHCAVTTKAVTVLSVIHDSWPAAYRKALATPADEKQRPAALAKALFDGDDSDEAADVCRLVGVIADPLGAMNDLFGYRCDVGIARHKGTPIAPRDAPAGGLQVLSLDGGGSRGILAIGALARLQEELPADSYIGDYFDVICGTSTGSLIAFALGMKRMTLAEIKTMYIALAKDMFGTKSKAHMMVNGTQYSTYTLRRNVKEQFTAPSGAPRYMSDVFHPDAHRPVLIATTSTKDDWTKLHVFGNYTRRGSDSPYPLINDVAVWQACRATSAAPTFFSPKALEAGGTEFVDGGVVVNNPINVAVRESREVFGDSAPFNCIVSLGCGFASKEEAAKAKASLFKRFKTSVLGALAYLSPLEIAGVGVKAIRAALAMATETEKHHDAFVADHKELLGVYSRVTLPLHPDEAQLDVADEKCSRNSICKATMRRGSMPRRSQVGWSLASEFTDVNA
jgi:predicted acylesterase/phospholipase RssA